MSTFALSDDQTTFTAGDRVFPCKPRGDGGQAVVIPLADGWDMSVIWYGRTLGVQSADGTTLEVALDGLVVLASGGRVSATYSDWPHTVEAAIRGPDGLQHLEAFGDEVAGHLTPEQFCELLDEWAIKLGVSL